MSLNFAPLNEPLSKADINTYEQSIGQKKYIKPVHLWILGVVLSVYIALVTITSGEIGAQQLVPAGIIFFSVLFYLSYRLRVKKLARIYKFAQANNFKLAVGVNNPAYNGLIFKNGHTRRIDEALILSNGSEIGNYQYSTGSGKNRRTYKWGYMKVKLVRNVPNMLLDSKKNNYMHGIMSNLPQSFDKSQTIKLEGNFNDYFTLYAPENYGRDAFYIFTPDVMAALIDHGSDFDIEVLDNDLMFYRMQSINLESEDEIKGLLAVLDKVSTELIDQADYYADERVADRSLDVIAEPGKRLKRRVPWIVIIAAVAIALYYIFAFAFRMSWE